MRRSFCALTIFCYLMCYGSFCAYADHLHDLLLVKPYKIRSNLHLRNRGHGNFLVGNIVILGNKRITRSAIIGYLGFRKNDYINRTIINQGLKNLYSTGLFSNVYITYKSRTVTIHVTENPIIIRLVFEGNKAVKSDLLSKQISLEASGVFDRNKAAQDVQTITSIYQKIGYLHVRVIPKIIRLSNNRVNLIYSIDEGSETRVEAIFFAGNSFFSSDVLKDVISTKENTWYRWFSTASFYDSEKMEYDRELLRRYYLTYGFIDFRVESVSELNKKNNGFILTFLIHEGARYKFRHIQVVSHVQEIDSSSLTHDLIIQPGDWYNGDSLQESIANIKKDLFLQGYPFVSITPEIRKDFLNHTVSVIFSIEKGQPMYINRINIRGNKFTSDKVIRRELSFSEGDPYNVDLIENSKRNLANLGFFQQISINTIPDLTCPDQQIVNVSVTEIPTTSILFSGGYSTDSGVLLGLGYTDNNFLGSGKSFSIQTQLGSRSKTSSINYVDPYFQDTLLSFSSSLSYSDTNYLAFSGYRSSNYGGSFGFGYLLARHLSQNISYGLSRERIYGVLNTESDLIKQEQGTRVVSKISHTLSYSSLDNVIWPTHGYSVSLSTALAGFPFFPDVKTLSNVLSINLYHRVINNDTTGWLLLESGHIQGLNKQSVAIQDRFLLGGQTLRGFQFGGIGPRDLKSYDSLGGTSYQRMTAQILFPFLWIPKELGFFADVFFDAGRLYGCPKTRGITHVVADHSLRESWGIGMRWRSPMGFVMKLDYAFPLKSKPYDQLQNIQFSIGTGF